LLENAKPDPRCDIYSAGVVLWEALTASRLFGGEGTDVQIALRILKGDMPVLRERRPELPFELAAIVERALARQPRDRYQRATEMIDALSQLLRRHPEPADGSAIARSVRNAKNILPKPTNPPPTAR
jgi:serine/threonine-protein kinase